MTIDAGTATAAPTDDVEELDGTQGLTPRQQREAASLAAAIEAGCDTCIHAVQHGWWGPLPGRARTHCRRCHRYWASLREAHCPGCCAHFATPKAADFHRRDGVCHDPAQVTKPNGEPRFRLVEGAFGPVWHAIGKPMPPELKARLRAAS